MTSFAAAREAARQFSSASSRLDLQPLGRGLINDTYLVAEGAARWVLQRINRRVFPDPVAVMANLRKVSDHALRLRKGCPESPWRLPEVIPTWAGEDTHRDERGDYWRAISYIDHARSLESFASAEQAGQVGRALGWFHGLVSELPADSLHDTLPGFHVTPLYLAGFDRVVDGLTDWPATPGLGKALAFVAARRGAADVLESAKAQGKLQPRVMHGDPKLDNVLFDTRSGQAVSLIDLDTVKPGLLHYDLGDCFRSCCNSAGEGAGQGSAAFDRRVFRAILEGYLLEAAHILTRDDRDYLFEAIRLLPFELGLRFLTDHLAGDVYFKVEKPGQNLTRALGQFRLTLDIEQQERAIRHILQQVM